MGRREDREWFEQAKNEAEEIIELIPKGGYDIRGTVQKIRNLLAEIDAQIIIGNPIGKDKLQFEKLLNEL